MPISCEIRSDWRRNINPLKMTEEPSCCLHVTLSIIRSSSFILTLKTSTHQTEEATASSCTSLSVQPGHKRYSWRSPQRRSTVYTTNLLNLMKSWRLKAFSLWGPAQVWWSNQVRRATSVTPAPASGSTYFTHPLISSPGLPSTLTDEVRLAEQTQPDSELHTSPSDYITALISHLSTQRTSTSSP